MWIAESINLELLIPRRSPLGKLHEVLYVEDIWTTISSSPAHYRFNPSASTTALSTFAG
jgi:hypothetical protein